MKAKLIITSLVLCLSSATLNAQFFTQGSDPGNLRWSQMETDAYKVIYPRGLDSLAKAYAIDLEANRARVGSSIGSIPGTSYSTRTPVILHTYHTLSNGLAFLAPRRMELFTVPDALEPLPMSNSHLLAIHESRHVAQLENYHNYPFRWANILFGSAAAGGLSAIYGGINFLEGDAVVTETALTNAGRGRNADFLEYMRVSFDEGQYRNYWQWRWGSLNRYTPDHYKIGYVSMAGIRTYLGAPDFPARFYERLIQHHGLTFYNMQKTVRETTGRSFNDGMDEILHRLGDDWKEDSDYRGPFYESKQITFDHSLFTEYKQLETAGGNIYAVRSGLDEAPTLVCIRKDGSEERLRAFSSSASRLQADPAKGRLYWSEYRAGERWELQSFSDICYLDAERKVHRLTSHHRFFNPAPAGDTVAVVEFPVSGGSKAVLLDAVSGDEIRHIIAPDNLQINELVWIDGELYCSAISSNEGFGLYRIDDFFCILKPQPLKISSLFCHDGLLFFTSDLNGVNELYSIDTVTKETRRWTNNRNGARDFRFAEGGAALVSSVLSTGGRNIFKTDTSLLSPVAVDFSALYEYPMAEELTEQEKPIAPEEDVHVSEPRDYSKLANLFNFHSWTPFFIDYDAVMNFSLEQISTNAGLGATAFFQNDLGTCWGTVGYHASPSAGEWRHSGLARFTYTGLFPVFETSFEVNRRNRTEAEAVKNDKGEEVIKKFVTDAPLASYSIKAYVPLRFNSRGFLRGVVPQVKVSGSNDIFMGKSVVAMSASLRGYTMLPVAPSNIYPRWGIGAELGTSFRPTMPEYYCHTVYGMVYGYVPGIKQTHGIRLSAIYAQVVRSAPYIDAISSMYPRGFDSVALSMISGHRQQAKLSFDYAFPFLALDCSALCPWFYLKNLELDIHYDLALFSSPSHSGNLWSAGADFKLRLANFLWIPYDARIGVSYNYNAGSSFDELAEKAGGLGRNSVSLIFGIDL